MQDEDGNIRYIGKTTTKLNTRLSSHLCDARRGMKNYRYNWIRSVISRGKLPSIFLISEVEGNGNNEEKAWIKYFRDIGVNLVNGTDGGEGTKGWKQTEKAKEKIRNFHIGSVHKPETLLKMSIAQKKRCLTEEGRQNIYLARSKSPGNTGKKASKESRVKMSQSAKASINSGRFKIGHKYYERKHQIA